MVAGVLLLAGAASAQTALKASGIESKGYQWNEMQGEKVAALALTGHVDDGKAAYDVCAACHLANGAGR
ncbi:hypothetical protein Q8G81_35215, partial [Klebsiella pneumoniae]